MFKSFIKIKLIVSSLVLSQLVLPTAVLAKDNCVGELSREPNPILGASALEQGVFPAFDKIKPHHFREAVETTIEKVRREIRAIKTNQHSDRFYGFDYLIQDILVMDRWLTRLNEYFDYYQLSFPDFGSESELSDLRIKVEDMSVELFSDPDLYKAFMRVYKNRKTLRVDQQRSVEKYYQRFLQNGATLQGEKKDRFVKIKTRLSDLNVIFRRNVREHSKASGFLVSDESELKGIQPSYIKSMKAEAEKAGEVGYMVTLQQAVVQEILENSENSELQKRVWLLNGRIAYKSGDTDNSAVIVESAKLRQELAKLLDFNQYSDMILADRMAGSFKNAWERNELLLNAYMPAALREEAELKAFVKSKKGSSDVEPWRRAYWVKKLKDEKFAVDQNLIREYLPLASVQAGLFDTLHQLFGVKMKKRLDLPKPDPDVEVFEVIAKNGETYGFVLVDLFNRAGKTPGAWMTQFSSSYIDGTQRRAAVVTVNMNLNKPANGDPALLTFGEGTTLFHEFGHAMHGVLTEAKYLNISGANITWDFVEFPSQLMEIFFRNKRFFEKYARHYKTGEALEPELIKAVNDASLFRVGAFSLRQLELQRIDFAWHHGEALNIPGDISQIESAVTQGVRVVPDGDDFSMSTKFGHVFGGGYESAYYSYLWADIYVATAASLFEQEGADISALAERLHKYIYAAGDSVDSEQAFFNFARTAPRIEELLKRDGVK